MVRGRLVAAAGVASLALAVLPAVGAHAGLDPVPPGFRATQVSAITSTNWWVLGSVSGCGGHRCAAIAHTTNGGVSFSLEKTSAHAHGTPTKARILRMSVDGIHGWILAPGRSVGFQLWRTSNAGWTWTRVPLAPRLSVLDVGGGKVWVAGREGSRAQAWSASANATSASAFTRRLDVPTVAVAGSPTLVAQPGGKALVLSFRPSDNRSRAYVVSASGFTAHNGPTWCDVSLGYGQVSSSHGTTWLDCPTGMADVYGYTKGGGGGWHAPRNVPGARYALGAVDATHAVVSGQGSSKLHRVTTGGTASTAHTPRLPSRTSFGFIGFTSPSVGFAVTDAGKLLVSKDGGSYWHAVTI